MFRFDGLSLTRLESQIVPSLVQCIGRGFYAKVFESFFDQGLKRTFTAFETPVAKGQRPSESTFAWK